MVGAQGQVKSNAEHDRDPHYRSGTLQVLLSAGAREQTGRADIGGRQNQESGMPLYVCTVATVSSSFQ